MRYGTYTAGPSRFSTTSSPSSGSGQTSWTPPTSARWKRGVRKSAGVIYIESPTNPTLELVDISKSS